MPISQITREAVLRAIAEYDELGRTAFLKRYGYRKARSYFLRFEGKEYDSKAVVGAARGYADSAAGPLKAAEFSGGDATVAQLLERLGFEIDGSLLLDASPAYWWVNHILSRGRGQLPVVTAYPVERRAERVL